IAMLQQSSISLKYSLAVVLHTSQRFRKSVTSVKSIYASSVVVNSITVGDTPYPRVDEKSEESNGSKGMGFELRNVSFSYPGTQATVPALKDISLIIKPGQLVVIVGANGSGKSTLIRILSRLYDPSSGQVLIDGLPSSSYRIDDLHTATTLLSQDNLIYPLSLGENIGLGYPECIDAEELIREAAEKGGALQVVQKLKDGMNTELDPVIEMISTGMYGNKNHPLYVEMEKMRKPIDISGGEKQRIVAARSFMRFKSGKVKFVAVDEPSSALDAEGELELFKNLLAVREGKTMVFVTHRFGHLTRHASLILHVLLVLFRCMKEGNIVERGSHAELMQKRGEYANLYEIQAGAFSDTTSK
ncbi:P-loop containing nucleoside triphosphate hydrolase protein, partial [Gymnopilus junonius]